MSESFGAGAERLCGAAAGLLGWRPAEFWSATPAELASALRSAEPACDVPEPAMIEALRRQFPDD